MNNEEKKKPIKITRNCCKNIKKRTISGILALNVLITSLTGCSNVLYEIDKMLSFPTTSEEMLEKPVIEEPIIVDINPYLSKINDVKADYYYNDYYFNENDYNELMNAISTNKECNHRYSYSLEEIYNRILVNSGLDNPNKLTKEQKELVEALKIALDRIFEQETFINNDDFCKLKDIKIKISNLENQGENITLAEYIDDELLILIDYEELLSQKEEEFLGDNKEYLSYTIQHELNHARQFICNCQKEEQINKTILYDDRVSFIIESSAESQLYYNELYNEEEFQSYMYSDGFERKQHLSFPYTYILEREYQSLILLMGMFKENFSLDLYYEAINDSNIDKLHKLFELNSLDDYKTFYNILYSIDTILNRTELSTYLIESGYNTFGKLRRSVGTGYKIDVFKIVVSDLIKEINEKDLSLEESMNLYNYIKAYIVKMERNSEKINGEIEWFYDEQLLNGITTIESIFYNYVCEKFDIDRNNMNFSNSTIFDKTFYTLIDYSPVDKEIYYSNDLCDNLALKYPLINEIAFCCNLFSIEIEDFDEAVDVGLVKTRN